MESEKKVGHAPAALESFNWEQLAPFVEERFEMTFAQIELSDADYKAKTAGSPERNLAASVLGVAFTDLKPIRDDIDRKMAYEFIMGHEIFHLDDWPYTAEKLADVLNLDIRELRRIATLMYHNPSQFRW